MGEWTKVLTAINLGVKLDKIVSIDMETVLWPVWICLACSLVLCVGSLLLVMVSLCSFYCKEANMTEIYSSMWLFYTTGAGSGTVLLFCYDLISGNIKRMCIWPIVYLSFFLFLTIYLKLHLLKWWRSFFISHEQISIPGSMSNSNPLPLPASQMLHIRFSTKVIRAIKLPPKALVRLSSTYFQPAPVKDVTKKTRTMSYDFKETSKESVHFRSLSTIPREPLKAIEKNLDFSYIEKKCSICCESECNSVLMDCGHGGICITCANVLMKTKGKCHMCRNAITQVLKIKLEPNQILNVIGTA